MCMSFVVSDACVDRGMWIETHALLCLRGNLLEPACTSIWHLCWAGFNSQDCNVSSFFCQDWRLQQLGPQACNSMLDVLCDAVIIHLGSAFFGMTWKGSHCRHARHGRRSAPHSSPCRRSHNTLHCRAVRVPVPWHASC